MSHAFYSRAIFLVSAHTMAQLPSDSGQEVAFAGRSNSGKSSVINVITGIKGLARTSKTPGHTRLINLFELPGGRRLADLPGYGYARVPAAMRRHWAQLLDAYFTRRRSLRGLILIMDIRRLVTPFDSGMVEFSRDAGLPVHVLLNKSDKLSKHQAQQARHTVLQAFDGTGTTVQLFSATRGVGVEEARSRLDTWFSVGD